MPAPFGLYVILTDPVQGYEACTRAAVKQNVAYVQLRMKDAPRDEILEVARIMRDLTHNGNTRFIVNDSVEIAAEADADGVHLGQDDMSLTEARAVWQADKIYGLSTHNEEQAIRAIKLKPDYIGVGPIYITSTKAVPDPTLGLRRMKHIISSSPLTTVAIGGINEENLPEVIAYGATNFALVRPVNQSPHPEQAIKRLMSIWQQEMNLKRK